ncbi:MAG: response regulator [Myxococcota bacterium]
MKVLLVEDDALLGDAVRAALVGVGYTVDWLRDGKSAVTALRDGGYALLVLDLGLPGIPGLDVLSRLRKDGSTIPVVILTARDTVNDRVRGLDRGADDYVVKPFEMSELLARVRALLRRAGGMVTGVLRSGAVTLDSAAHRVTHDGVEVELSPREFALLQELMEHAGRALTREQLERCLYGWQEEVSSNAVEVHIHHIRRKLGDDVIRTIRGVGYLVPRP